MAETRKRSHSVEDDKVILKKHIISDENGSPRVNGASTEDVESTTDDKVENFRKEAIYRRMLHYRREHETSQSRISELEKRKTTCEASLAAMSACWMQLVDAIRVLVDPPAEASPSTKNLQELFTLSNYVSEDSLPELRSALEKSQHATQELVLKLVQKGSSQVSQDAALKQYQKTQSECSALRAQVQILQVRLSDCEEHERQLRQKLSDEQNRVERLKSQTVQANLPKPSVGSPEATEDATIKPSSPAPNGVPSKLREELSAGHMRQLHEQDKVIQELRRAKASLEIDLERKSLKKEEVQSSPVYQRLLQRSANALSAASLKEDELKQLKGELATYKQEREKYEKELRDESANAINDTLSLIARRDADNARLREERDQRTADIHERRSKDGIKISSCEEFKTLAASQADRIAALESQLHRTKLKLAANAGREDIVKFLLETPGKDIQLVEHLQGRFSETESRLSALEDVLVKLNKDHPNVAKHAQSEAEALHKLTEVTALLTKYQNVYGELSSQDQSQLASQLQRKEEELRRLRLLDSQHSQAESALYSEIEKLSSAWETLDSQVRSKVLDLNALEERLSKATIERAKADNKYYAIVREKDTIEAERKSSIRSLERQAKALESLKQSEHNLTEQLKAAHVELEKHRGYCQEVHEVQIKNIASKSLDLQERANEGARLAAIYRDKIIELEREHQSRLDGLRKEMDSISAAKLALENDRVALQAKTKLDSTRQENKEDPEAEQLKRVLKCSTCNINFRDTLLLKCSHSFCKSCVDARISSRQRKCPACGTGFAQSEAIKIFMQ